MLPWRTRTRAAPRPPTTGPS